MMALFSHSNNSPHKPEPAWGMARSLAAASTTHRRCLGWITPAFPQDITHGGHKTAARKTKYNVPTGMCMGLTRLPSAENSPKRGSRQKKLQTREARRAKYLCVTCWLQNPGQSWGFRCFNQALHLGTSNISTAASQGWVGVFCFVMVSAGW